MQRFMRNMNFGGLGRDLQTGGPPGDTPMVDTAEQVYISSLSLLKMLKHGRAGVPMEVMGSVFVCSVEVLVISVISG